MSTEGIPGVEPPGETQSTLKLLVGLAIYVLTLLGLVAYLVWKLPREGGQEEGPPEADEGGGSGEDTTRG